MGTDLFYYILLDWIEYLQTLWLINYWLVSGYEVKYYEKNEPPVHPCAVTLSTIVLVPSVPGIGPAPGWHQPLFPQNRPLRTVCKSRQARRRARGGILSDLHGKESCFSSFLLDNRCISFPDPHSKVVRPLTLIREVCGDNRQVILFGRAYNVYWMTSFSETQKKTTWPSRVLGIILYHLTFRYNLFHLRRGDHPIGSHHLSQCMWQKQNFLVCSRTNPAENICFLVHVGMLTEHWCFFNFNWLSETNLPSSIFPCNS